MIFENYILVKNYLQQRKIKEDNEIKHVNAFDDIYGGQNQVRLPVISATSVVIALILYVVIGIAIAYMLYNCIKSQCMGFILFLVFIVCLNIPMLNIIAFIALVIYYFAKCRGKCRK